MKDTLFNRSDTNWLETFVFNKEVVDVFDDMVTRSVPMYKELQEMLGRIAYRFSAGNTIYDLGCSTGATLEQVLKVATKPIKIVGIDNSPEMLAKCAERLASIRTGHDCVFRQDDLATMSELKDGDADSVILCLVLQFLRPIRRLDLLRVVYNRMRQGGCMLLVEKVLFMNADMNAIVRAEYHDYKRRNGYSDLEIASKREALENRLIPFQPEENLALLAQTGFRNPAIVFAYGPFQAYLGIK